MRQNDEWPRRNDMDSGMHWKFGSGILASLSTIAPRFCLLSHSTSYIHVVVHCSTFTRPWARNSSVLGVVLFSALSPRQQ